jgi:hypothetical protein
VKIAANAARCARTCAECSSVVVVVAAAAEIAVAGLSHCCFSGTTTPAAALSSRRLCRSTSQRLKRRAAAGVESVLETCGLLLHEQTNQHNNVSFQSTLSLALPPRPSSAQWSSPALPEAAHAGSERTAFGGPTMHTCSYRQAPALAFLFSCQLLRAISTLEAWFPAWKPCDYRGRKKEWGITSRNHMVYKMGDVSIKFTTDVIFCSGREMQNFWFLCLSPPTSKASTTWPRSRDTIISISVDSLFPVSFAGICRDPARRPSLGRVWFEQPSEAEEQSRREQQRATRCSFLPLTR